MTQSYGTTAKFLHWLIAALLIGQYLLGWLMPDIKRGMTPGTAMNLHVSIGFVVLVLIVARFAWRLTHKVAPDAGLPQWQRMASESVHLVIYLLVLATTLSGWFFASMRGWTLVLFGVVPLPGLVSQGSALGRTLGQLHGKLIWVLLAAIVVHVIAALVHLFVCRDRVMQRMLPAAIAAKF